MNILENIVSEVQISRSAMRLFMFWPLVATLLVSALPVDLNGQDVANDRNGSSSCSRIAKNNDFLFITYEHKSEHQKGSNKFTLRLHNNSTCSVIITSGSAKNFKKALPPIPTVADVLNREIDYTLPDSVYVPELQYKFNAMGKERNAIGGDSFFGFSLLPKNSILFEVALEHFGVVGAGNVIAVPFQYDWELKDQTGNIYPSIEHRVVFWTDSLPDEVKARLARR